MSCKRFTAIQAQRMNWEGITNQLFGSGQISSQTNPLLWSCTFTEAISGRSCSLNQDAIPESLNTHGHLAIDNNIGLAETVFNKLCPGAEYFPKRDMSATQPQSDDEGDEDDVPSSRDASTQSSQVNYVLVHDHQGSLAVANFGPIPKF